MRNKYLLLILIVFLIISSVFMLNFAQDKESTRELTPSDKNSINIGVPSNVLIELFINTDCSTCPKAAFCLEDLAWNSEPGRVILVEAHIWDDGYDLPRTNARYDWYTGNGIKGTPDAFFNGLSERVQGLCCDCGDIDKNINAYQEIIDKHLTKLSPIEIKSTMENRSGKIIIQGSIANKSHTLLHNLMLNGMVYYEGDESEFYYLVKDIFDEQDICQLAPLEEKKFNLVSNIDLSDIDSDELERYYCVLFVQEKLSKEVLQTLLIK